MRNQENIAHLEQTLAFWLSDTQLSEKYIEKSPLPQLPLLPSLGIPGEVLQHRPDISIAFAKVKMANEDLAIAMAERLPRVTLRANYASTKNQTQDLFDDWGGNLVSGLIMPVFDAGNRKASVQQKELELEAVILDYKETWLSAIYAISRVMSEEKALVSALDNLLLQLDLANKTEQLTALKYFNGRAQYLSLLKAQESVLSLERQLIDAKRKLLVNRVLLYRELSHGDFEMPAKPETQVAQLAEGGHYGS